MTYQIFYVRNRIFAGPRKSSSKTVVEGFCFFGFRLSTKYLLDSEGLVLKALGLLTQNEVEQVYNELNGTPSTIIVSHADVGCRMSIIKEVLVTFRAMTPEKVEPTVGESFETRFVMSADKSETDVAVQLAEVRLIVGQGEYRLYRPSFKVKRDKKLLPFARYGKASSDANMAQLSDEGIITFEDAEN